MFFLVFVILLIVLFFVWILGFFSFFLVIFMFNVCLIIVGLVIRIWVFLVMMEKWDEMR